MTQDRSGGGGGVWKRLRPSRRFHSDRKLNEDTFRGTEKQEGVRIWFDSHHARPSVCLPVFLTGGTVSPLNAPSDVRSDAPPVPMLEVPLIPRDVRLGPGLSYPPRQLAGARVGGEQ